MAEKFSPDVVSPKSNIRFSKRLALLLGFGGVLIIFAILHFSRNTSTVNNEQTAEKAMYHPAMSSGYTIDTETSPPWPADDFNAPPVPETPIPDNRNNYAYDADPSAEAANNAQKNLRMEWLEYQRMTFFSLPEVSGSWVNNNAVEASETEGSHRAVRTTAPQSTAREDLLSAYMNGQGIDRPTSAMSKKEEFFSSSKPGKGYLDSTRTKAISPFVLPAGTLIPCTLISGINSDLPGNITAQVTESVFDWVNHKIILIPQGTKVFGVYDADIAFAQKRVQISWTRLSFPDGSYIDLGGMPGTDRQGYSGLRDKYYPRYGRLLTAAVATAALGSVGLLFDDSNNKVVTASNSTTVVVPANNTTSAQTEFAKKIAESIGGMGEKYFDKVLDTPPTVLIRPGTRFNIQVDADIPFYNAWR